MKKFGILLALGAIIAAYLVFDLGDYLTLEGIKALAREVDAAYSRDPGLVIAIYFLAYVGVVTASLPGAAIMTLAAGALFGLFLGTIIVSFASTIGATLAFLASRFLFRDFVEARLGSRLKAVNQGLARDGSFYLFTLRMIPLFPFFVVNLVMGLTRIRTLTFALVSQVGMILGTIVYVNAGTQLATINTLSDIVSPQLLLSFALLGLAPWLGKAIVASIRKRRTYAGFERPRRFDRNLIVIGAGSAGLVAAYIAAQVKASVTLIEAGKMGGDCLNTGCIPSKALIKSAKLAAQMRNADRYGLTPVDAPVPFKSTISRVLEAIRAIEPHDSVERFESLGVDVISGYARIVDPWTIEVSRADGTRERLTTRSIVIATGASPSIPPIEGLSDTAYLTSETMWDAFAQMEEAPRRVVVLGGGPIGCEISQALARLGSSVTLIERASRLMEREDDEVSAFAQELLEADGVQVLTGHDAVRINEGAVVVNAGSLSELPFDTLIVAVGRTARLEGYGLEELGVDCTKTVVTDEFLSTKFPNIYAAGDVAGPYQFTHTASHQAWYASVNALFGQFRRFKADYRVIPSVTFLDPEIARVGLNEREAREVGVQYEVTRYDIGDLDRAIAESERQGFVKVLTEPGKDKLLGVTIASSHAGEMLSEYVLAMKNGIGLNKILGTIHSYPTFAEANKFVAGEWKKNHKPERLLRWVERYHRWRLG